MASYEYRGDDGVDRRSSREWFQRRPFVAQIASTDPTITKYYYTENATNSDRSFGGVILSSAGQPGANANYNQYFISNGVLAPVDFGARLMSALAAAAPTLTRR
jgi:hypothetical protein